MGIGLGQFDHRNLFFVSQCSNIQVVGFASSMWKPFWLSLGRRSYQSHRSTCAANGCKRVAAAMKLSRAFRDVAGAQQVCSSKRVNIDKTQLVAKKNGHDLWLEYFMFKKTF